MLGLLRPLEWFEMMQLADNFLNSNTIPLTIITVVYNRERTIVSACQSLYQQSFTQFEHLVIDGASTDGTVSAIEQCADSRTVLHSEPDQGIYDALNKGLARARGDVIGILHSDDLYYDHQVLHQVMQCFNNPEIDLVYGDLVYVSASDIDKTRRNWVAGVYQKARLKQGWVPPHPTLFVRRRVLQQIGPYNLAYKISSDFDHTLRLLLQVAPHRVHYLPHTLVKMRMGGVSNGSLAGLLKKAKEDCLIAQRNRLSVCAGVDVFVFKVLSKVKQFFIPLLKP